MLCKNGEFTMYLREKMYYNFFVFKAILVLLRAKIQSLQISLNYSPEICGENTTSLTSENVNLPVKIFSTWRVLS